MNFKPKEFLNWTGTRLLEEVAWTLREHSTKTKQQVSWDYFLILEISWEEKLDWQRKIYKLLRILGVRRFGKQKANTSIYKTNENARWRRNEESKHDKMKKPKNMAKWRNKWRQKTKPRSGIINSEDEALNLIISYITT